MKQKYVLLVVAAIFGLLLAAFAGKAAANSAAFAFTMEKRAVWGNKNKRFYTLDAGELTLSGGLWVVSKNRGSSSAPDLDLRGEVKRGWLASQGLWNPGHEVGSPDATELAQPFF